MNDSSGRDPERREQRKLELISQEAAEWFLRLKDPRVSRQEKHQFREWLSESWRHVAEYLRVALLYGRLRQAKLDAWTALPGESNVVNLNLRARAGAAESVRSAARTGQGRIAATAAGLAVAFLLGSIANGVWQERRIQTDLGEWRNVGLADGSIVRLGPGTHLRLHFGDTRRSVHLHGGEAYFEVAKDPARPFLVTAEPLVVRAVGTEFGVTRRAGAVTVSVAEGAVEVTPSGTAAVSLDHASKNLSIPLSESEEISTSGAWPVTVRRIEVENVLAWKDQRLVFDGTTLANAIQAFNTRNRLKLEAPDPEEIGRAHV